MQSLESIIEYTPEQFASAFKSADDDSVFLNFRKQFSSRLASMHLPDDLISTFTNIYIPTVNLLQRRNLPGNNKVTVIGISGSQGSGKSTFTTILADLLEEAYGYRVVSFSIDDFYHTRKKREELGKSVHPLLITRGVPGTHDVELGINTLIALQNARDDSQISIPVFDKSIDDRKHIAEWKIYSGRPDIILFEGWCLGAVPEPEETLLIPVNALERDMDKSAVFRTYVNKQLSGSYQKWFSFIDFLITLLVPSFDLVYEWRLLQEKKLANAVRYEKNEKKVFRIMSEEEIYHFVSHYERITRYMLKEMPNRSNLIINIGEDHNFNSVRYNQSI